MKRKNEELINESEKKKVGADKASNYTARKMQELKKARIYDKQTGMDEFQALKDEGCMCATHGIKIPLCAAANLGENTSSHLAYTEGQN